MHVASSLKKTNIEVGSCRGSIHAKNKAIREFNNEQSNCRIILLSSKYSASGINLTRANRVLFVDPVYGSKEFRQQIEEQAIARSKRLGQTKNVYVVRFLIRNTVEEEIYNSY